MSQLKKELQTLREENKILKDKIAILDKSIGAHRKTEEALSKSREEFKSIFDNAKDSILIETIDGKIIAANRAACRMLGYDKEALTKLTVGDIVPEHIARTLPSEIRATSMENGNYIESEQLLKSGQRIPVEVSITLVDIGGEKRVIAILRDITDRKRAEASEELQAAHDELESRIKERTTELARSNELLKKEIDGRQKMEKELRDSEEKYRGLFNISPEGIMLFDLTGNLITGNDRICQLYGYSHDELLKLSLKDIVPEKLAGNFPLLVENLRKSGDLFFESQGKKRDGSIFPAELSAGIFLWKGEASVQVLVKDITQRKQVEEALEASKIRLRTIIENSADGILIIDKTGTVRFVNPATERLFERKAEELIGEPFSIPLGGGETVEIVIGRRDGKKRTVETRVSEIHWEGMTAYLASLRDITGRKELEKLKDDFIDTVSHEMRNPLAVLRIGIGQIKDGIPGEINEDQNEILSLTLGEINRLTRLVNNLLDLSKIEAGRVTLKMVLLDFNSLIKDAEEQFRQTAREKDLKLAVTPLPEPLVAYADRDRMHQVLINLVGNALKFTPAGGEINISVTEEGGEIECSITDSGIGISPADQSRVFDKFTQCSYPNEGDTQGSGLGLAITRELVEMHGGKIRLESKPDRGSRFIFRIPDHRSEKSLATYLESLMALSDGKESRLALLGFRIEKTDDLRREWGEEIFSSFSRQLFQRLSLMIQDISRLIPHCWLMDDSHEFVAVLNGPGENEIRRIHEKVLRKLKKLKFRDGENTLEFELRSAWVTPGDREAGSRDLVDALESRLALKKSIVTQSKSRGKVLIVDDNPTIIKLLTSFLNKDNIETEAALDGKEALNIAFKNPVDLIILDLELPEISGYEVINQLKKNNKTFDIPLILISGYDIDLVRLERDGTRVIPTFIQKPFEFDQLREMINQKLEVEDIPV